MPPRRTWLWFALILLANFLLVRFLFPGPEAPIEVPYTFFKEEVRAGNVEAIYSQGDSVEGRFENPVTDPPKGEEGSKPDAPPSRTSETFTTVLPSFVDPGLGELLTDNGVEISAEPIQEGGGLWQTLLFAFGPALLLIGGYIWLYRRAQQQGGGMAYALLPGNWGIVAIALGLGAAVLGLDRLRGARGRPECAIGWVFVLTGAFIVVDAVIWMSIGGA